MKTKLIFGSGFFDRLFGGHLTFAGRKLSKAMGAGVLAVIFMFVGTAGVLSASLPEDINSGDTRAHVDYIWRVYNGQVPRLDDGITYKPFNLSGSRRIQPQANHPPLFYAINAPFVGPLLKKGDWQNAIGLARAINIFIGVLCVLALAWAGWLYGGKRGELFAVAVPALGVMLYRFSALNIVYGPDYLLVLLTTLTFVGMYKVIKHGLKTKYIAWLGVLAVLGMSTKVGYLPVLAAAFIAIGLAALLHSPEDRRRQMMRAVLYTGIIAAAVAFAVGWFYYIRNYQTSGTWFRATPDEYSGGRPYKSLSDVLFGEQFRALFYEKLAQNGPLSTFITVLAAAGLVGLKQFNLKKFFQDKSTMALVAVLLIAGLGAVVGQVTFAVGYGAVNLRYLLPVLLPIGLLLSYGLLEFRWTRGQLTAGAAVLLGLSTIFPGFAGFRGRLHSFVAGAAHNGISSLVIYVLLALFLIGSTFLCLALYRLTMQKTETT